MSYRSRRDAFLEWDSYGVGGCKRGAGTDAVARIVWNLSAPGRRRSLLLSLRASRPGSGVGIYWKTNESPVRLPGLATDTGVGSSRPRRRSNIPFYSLVLPKLLNPFQYSVSQFRTSSRCEGLKN